MEFKTGLLILLILSIKFVRADYELSEEEEAIVQKSEAKEDFWKNFSCMVATQRFIAPHNETLNSLRVSQKYLKVYNKCYSNIFRQCFNTLTDEEKEQVTKAKTRNDFDLIVFSGLRGFKITQFFNNNVGELDDEEKDFLRIYEETNKKVTDMQKNTMRENPENEEPDMNELLDELKKRKQGKPQIGSIDLDNKKIKFVGFICVIAIIGGLFYFAFKLTDTKDVPDKKKSKSKKNN